MMNFIKYSCQPTGKVKGKNNYDSKNIKLKSWNMLFFLTETQNFIEIDNLLFDILAKFQINWSS